MQILRRHAYARAGLIGNPSDGYHGKTIALVVPQFAARVVLYEWEDVEIVWSQEDRGRFRSVRELVEDVRNHGYYGGVRLIKATIKRFVEYCRQRQIDLHDRNFSIRYETDIPRQVGLGGSSAIIVATLRALIDFYEIEIPPAVQPSLALAVETEELGIAAGLQDRVVQVYNRMVFMDFSLEAMHRVHGFDCGRYEPLEPADPPRLYLAYHTAAGEPTEVFHNDLRARHAAGEASVVKAMRQFALLAAEARGALLDGDHQRLAGLLDANFDLRRSICRLPEWQVDMVLAARRAGAAAKFAGSGGAIIGTYRDATMFQRLCGELQPLRCRVLPLNTAGSA